MHEPSTHIDYQPLLLLRTNRTMHQKMRINDIMPVVRIYRCDGCDVWWVKGQMPYSGQEQLLFRFLAPFENLYAWEDYRGWRLAPGEGHICPCCGENAGKAVIRLMKTAAP